MRALLFAVVALFAFALPGTAQAASTAPFAVAPVSVGELAQSVGMGDPRWRTSFRLTDDLAASNQRQIASIGATIKDLWLIDVGSPLIAANIRASRP